ncbi:MULTISPECIES: glycosyltransferase [unclassified Rhizobacter]|uniref:MraY family glycosyltransferase n=1 Tax=unclassified Rhizobacter TaxID=2640088 RepID=UPI0006F7BDC7|nr:MULTISPECIES: glycosyltransferase [unclassified Rhizobacter]KQU75015.1 glycosyl transferase [Rhizobacter sp. Root29]KQW01177.1 glycosyl transferase [Rhizobacter sp. Root1238]KRB03987.1 glycosyl transferase [Rhizobacter sp. Root16D2]
MIYFTSGFLVAFCATLLILRISFRHGNLLADYDLSGPQKFHSRVVPRVGGLGVMAAILGGVMLAQTKGTSQAQLLWLLVLSATPCFITGIAEDLTKKVSPRKRLIATAISAALAAWLLDAVIRRTDIPGVDQLIGWYPFAMALTLFVVTGVSNAVNIIDGFNGLASMCVLMMMLALAYVAFQVGDGFVFAAALITAGAIFGFFVWNFPAGLIFLGDGGAYLLGFLLAELSILMLHRNSGISPLFPLLLCAYPIFETIFTIYRRKVVRGVATAEPDGIHLHTLIHRRLIRWTLAGAGGNRRLTRRNSMTSPYLWLLCLSSVIPSLLWWDDSAMLSGFLLLFVVSYVWLYSRIVRFKTPKWLIFRRTN